jgi:hypothetical protein
MRVFLIFTGIIVYLFLLVFLESELVKSEVRLDELKSRVVELRNRKKQLEFELSGLTNLADIEAAAKAMGYFFPDKDDILGVVE